MSKTEVTFDIDASGVVHVSAKDQGTQKEQQIVLQLSGGLSTEQIEQMVNVAEKFAEGDEQGKKDLIEVVNTAESVIYDTQKNMDEYKSQLPPEEAKNVEEEISDHELKQTRMRQGRIFVRPQIIFRGRATMKLFEFAYKHRGSSGGGSSSEGSSNKGSLSQPEAHHHQLSITEPLHDFVEEPHRLLKALPPFDRTGKLI